MRGPKLLMVGAAPFLAAAALCLLSDRAGQAEGEDLAAQAKEAWHGTCQKCHHVPDATFETGRAFLRQITETS